MHSPRPGVLAATPGSVAATAAGGSMQANFWYSQAPVTSYTYERSVLPMYDSPSLGSLFGPGGRWQGEAQEAEVAGGSGGKLGRRGM